MCLLLGFQFCCDGICPRCKVIHSDVRVSSKSTVIHSFVSVSVRLFTLKLIYEVSHHLCALCDISQ